MQNTQRQRSRRAENFRWSGIASRRPHFQSLSKLQLLARCCCQLLAGLLGLNVTLEWNVLWAQSPSTETLAPVVENSVKSLLQQLDRNADQLLTLEEFLVHDQPDAVQRRDFQLFDFDHDARLSPREFATIPGVVGTGPRGPLPDPLDDVAQVAFDALQEAFQDWQKKPAKTFEARLFLSGFLTSFSPSKSTWYDPAFLPQVDPDQNGEISHFEAERFLRIQLGLLTPAGNRLHGTDGRVVDVARFHRGDADGNQYLSLEEFQTEWPSPTATQDFSAIDTLADQSLSLEEYALSPHLERADPILWFCQADTNLDAVIDPQELAAAIPPARRSLLALDFGVFDTDQNGSLTLEELRLSMYGNWSARWENFPQDVNQDGKLSMAEFRFPHGQAVLVLRRFYFEKFDRDGDHFLTPREYPVERMSANRSMLRPFGISLGPQHDATSGDKRTAVHARTCQMSTAQVLSRRGLELTGGECFSCLSDDLYQDLAMTTRRRGNLCMTLE